MSRIAFITPTLTAGGSERVLALVANHVQQKNNTQVHIILLTGGEIFYNIEKEIIIHRPDFDYLKFNRIKFTWKIFYYLRRKLKEINPQSLLCFGGRYNSFVLLASQGLGIRTYISDRSMPGMSYGWLIDSLNRYLYKKATGVIVQTESAKVTLQKKIKHTNIKVIGNPIKPVPEPKIERKKIILNVGRFIESKHQDWLIEYFVQIGDPNWELWLVGDGPSYKKCFDKANRLEYRGNIIFWSNQKNITDFYIQSSIFAFTSTSEGFPNALGEAMAAGCACISFDCIAGPSDLIDNDINGYIIPIGDRNKYMVQLRKLMLDDTIRKKFSNNATETMKSYDANKINELYCQFITPD